MANAPAFNKPYRDLALIYDELIGNAAFECWKEVFGRLSRRYGMQFEVAADIACGTGLAAQYIASLCSRVYAVDRSAWMLDVARERDTHNNIVFLEQPFTRLALPEPVDILTCNFDSLNYLTQESDLKETLRRFASNIKPGGHAVFDMNTTRELACEWGDSVLVHRLNRGFSIWEMNWDERSRTNTLRMTNFIKVDGDKYRMSEELHQERSYDLELVVKLIGRAGFKAVEAYDAKGLDAVSEDTRRVQFVARV